MSNWFCTNSSSPVEKNKTDSEFCPNNHTANVSLVTLNQTQFRNRLFICLKVGPTRVSRQPKNDKNDGKCDGKLRLKRYQTDYSQSHSLHYSCITISGSTIGELLEIY